MIDSYIMLIQNRDSGEIYDVSGLASDIQYFSSIEGQPGKLSFVLEKDPNNILVLGIGSIVVFKVVENKVEKGIFFGNVFTIGTDATEAYRVVAYDSMRYLQNQDVYIMKNKTASQLFSDICTKTNINRYSVVIPSGYILEDKFFNKETYYNMIDWACNETLLNSPMKQKFFIRDVFGTLEFNELENAKTDYIIGDESMLTDYQYELDIDKDTYNRVKIVKASEKAGITKVEVNQSVENVVKWGLLQFVKTVGDKVDEAKMKDYANQILKLKNRINKSMKLNALGIPELRAGSGFLLVLNKLNIKQWMYIDSITHHYDMDYHTMEMEVSIV